MAQFSAKKIDTTKINGGNEITDGSGATPEVFNAPINSALYTEKAIEILTSQLDTSDVGKVGTPSVIFVTKVEGGIAYKYLKLSNLKGQQGQTGQTGPQGETGSPAGFGTPVVIVNTLPAGSDATATVTATGKDTAKVFKFTLGIPKGEQGLQGLTGEKGEDGHTPVITIGANGNWFIDGVDTKVQAQGIQGEQGAVGPQGPQGATGAEGHTPVITIGANGNWFVDGVDTGVQAQGVQGEQGEAGPQGTQGEQGIQGERGIGIKSVTTSGNDLVITFDDDSKQVVKDALKPINELPQTSSSDSGKFFMVGENGEVVVRALPVAEELYV